MIILIKCAAVKHQPSLTSFLKIRTVKQPKKESKKKTKRTDEKK